jgi:mono/diheme cytochrome c family protein
MGKHVTIAGLALAVSWAAPALGQTSVWDGTYTAAQAARGAAQYQQKCVMCHGPVLEGNGEAPPLVGRFIPDWAGTSLADLFEKIQATMPLFAPASLSSSDTADILAFLLQSNNFPSGPGELKAGDGLRLVSFDAAKPMPRDGGAGKKR